MIKSLGIDKTIRDKYEDNLKKKQKEDEDIKKLSEDLAEFLKTVRFKITCPLCGEIIEYGVFDQSHHRAPFDSYINCPNCHTEIDTSKNTKNAI